MGNFLVGLWNAVVAIFPTVMHAACQITEGVSNAAKLGGGS